MADKTQNNTQAVNVEINGKTCEVTSNALGQGVEISDLREELGLEVLSPTHNAGAEAGEEELAQLDVQAIEDDGQIQPPSQDKLSNEKEFGVDGDLAEIQPAAGEEGSDTVLAQDEVEKQAEEEIVLSEAQRLSEIEPAAGDAGAAGGVSSASGYGFQSSFDAQGILAIDDVGPIDPTALEYGIEFRRDDNFFDEEAELPVLNPSLSIDDQQVYEDGSVTIFASASAELPTSTMTIVISGIPAGWDVSADAYDSASAVIGTGVFDSAAGTWTMTVPAGSDFNGGPIFSPPADSDIDALDLVFTVTEENAVTGQSGTADGGFDIIVDAVADDPDVDAADASGDEGDTLPIDISGLTGEEVNNGVGADDGSESVVEYEVSGVPAGFTLSAGTETAPNSGVYILTEGQLAGLTITPTDPNYSGSITLTATIRTTENPVSDGEFDTSNNDAQNSEDFVLTWNPVADKPKLSVDDAQVKEDSSVFIPVEAELADTDGSEFLTITVEGIPSTWNFTGTSWVQTGPETYEITVPAGDNYDDGFTLAPPEDSDLDLTGITVTATSTETANGDNASISEDIDVIVDAVADAPSITGTGDSGDEGATLDIDISGLTGEEVNNGVGADDGSESVVEYEVSGVPAGFTLSAGTETAPNSGVYILTEGQLAGLTITPTDPNYSGSITLTATIRTTENPVSDGEFDTSDNNAESSTTIDLTWAPVINPPCIKVNNGVDDALVKEDGTVDVPVTAQLGDNPSSAEYLTVTVTGIDPSWGDFFAPIGTYTPATGTWTITLASGVELDTVFTFSPAADSDIDLTGMVATVVATDPSVDPELTADASDGFNVIVDAVADAPNLNAGPDATAEEGATIPLTITTSVNDVDGSEVIELVKISGLPTGTSLTAGTYNAIDDVWELSVTDLTGLGLVVADGATEGNYTLTVESVAYEQNTNGTEVDLTDNRASAFDDIEITIEADDVPCVKGDEVTVDETDLAPTTSVSGAVSVDYGSDAPGTVTANGSYFTDGLKSGGELIDVAYDDVANTYTGTAGGETIFVLTVNSDGTFDFVLEGVVDHPDDTNHDDSVAVEFGVTATDSDGDERDAVITVNIKDDGPYIHDKFKWVDETDLVAGPIGYTHTIPHDFGEDGPGEIEPTGNFYAAFQVGGPNQDITTGGVKVDVAATADGYVGTANGEEVFTLTIDSQTGEYTYTQFKAIDHPDDTNHDDVIWLKFEVQIVDADGDTDTAIIGVDVHDDGPIANDDAVKMNEDDGSVSGNVIENDVESQDFDNTVTEVSFGGAPATGVPQNGDYVEILGANGKLLINMYGDYTYTPFDDTFDKTAGGSTSLDPVSSDVSGTQETFTKNGITVTVANDGDFDIKWVSTSDGDGLGVDNLNNGDSTKVWPKGETFDISFEQVAQTVTLTISELGSNNNNGNYGLDYVLYFTDGTSAVAEQQFVSSEIVDGHFTFTIDAADYGDKQIESLDINSTNEGQFYGSSFLLNNVAITYPDDCPECVEDDFEYTLTDADGDSDTAVLHVEACPSEAVLIVGQNVDDTEDSVVPHLVNGDEGVIIGDVGNDILVGDAGGSQIIDQTQDYNFVFILDVSGSMGSASDASSRISLLKASVLNLLADLGGYQDGEIVVHITPFATDVKTTATFNVTDANGLADALAFIDNLNAFANGDGSGYTNYESPLVEANTWLQSDEPLDNAITTTYFISDGEPNRYLNTNDVVTSGSAGTVINEITGADGSDEVATLHSLNDDVIAVGINASSSLITRLSIIDIDGDAVNVDEASDLSVVFEDTSPLDLLLKAGGDVIDGHDGDDIIFGDVLYTDGLADVYGIGAEDGAGWEVFERLEAGESAASPDWTRDDTIDYIRNNAEELAQESLNSEGLGRQGGDDMIFGGAGDDVIFGQEGNDIISGGQGADQLYGGSGSDIFLYESQDEGSDTIYDFTKGEDQLDLSLLLGGYDDLTDDIAEFVIATESGGNTIIAIDQSGNSGASGSFELAVLQGVTGLDLDAAIKSGATTV